MEIQFFTKPKKLWSKTNNRCPSMPIYDLNYKNAQPTIGSDNRQSTKQSQRRNTSTLHLSQLQTVIRGKKCPVLYNVQCIVNILWCAHKHMPSNFLWCFIPMTKIDMESLGLLLKNMKNSTVQSHHYTIHFYDLLS